MPREKFNTLEKNMLDLLAKLKKGIFPEKEELISFLEEMKDLPYSLHAEKNTLFKNLFINFPEPVAVFEKNDSDGSFILVDINDACALRERVNKEEIIGEKIIDAFPCFSDRRLIDTLNEVLKTGKQKIIEYKTKEKKGNFVWYKSRVLKLKSGELFVSSVDITEEKKAEEKLKESERKYFSLFNNPKWILLMIDFKDQKIIDANPGAELFYGWTHDEFLNMKISEINVMPTEEITRKMKEAKEKKIPYFEFKHRKKDGSESYVAVFKGKNFILNNREVFCVIVLDLTERKNAEAALIESEKRYRKLLDSGNVAIFVHPMKKEGFNKFIEVNEVACDWLGYTRDELLNMSVEEVVSPEDAKLRGSRASRKELLNSGRMFFEDALIAKNKRIIPVEVYSNIISYKNSKVILSIAHDITEKIKAEVELKKRMTELERFNKIMVGRELRMVALKKEINNLLKKLGEPEKYNIR